MTSTTTRRDLMLAAPAAGLALTLPAGAVEPESRIMALYRRWLPLRHSEFLASAPSDREAEMRS